MLSDTEETTSAPAVSLQGQGVVFKEECIDSSDPVGEYEFVHHAWFVYEGSVESPELEVPQIALIAWVAIISPCGFF